MTDNPFSSPAADGIRNAERDRIVAIIMSIHRELMNDYFRIRGHDTDYALGILDRILAEIGK